MKKSTLIKLLLIPWALTALYICFQGCELVQTVWQAVMLLVIEIICLMMCLLGMGVAEQTKEDDMEILRLRRNLRTKK